jgi:acetolactate synthase-1/2/3 large subunit
MDGSEALVQSLEDAGVEYVFGLPGSVIMNTIDKFVDRDVGFVSARHEQVAATMADGYARVSGKPGVTLTHVGPGAANQIIGVAAAYRDASPVVSISGNEDQPRLGRDIWHEWDVESVFEPFTKWNTRIERGEDAARQTRQALVKSVSGRPGPVHLDLPLDVSTGDAPYTDADADFFGEEPVSMPMARPEPNRRDVERSAELLEAAESPVVLAGGGCVRSEAGEALEAFVEAARLPVVTSNSGRGILSERHPLALGVAGKRGTDGANAVLSEADLVLGVGARFSALSTDNWSLIDADTDLVQVDIRPEEMASQYPVEVGVVADARAYLRALTETGVSSDWAEADLEAAKEAVEAELAAFFDYPEKDSIGPRQLYAVIQDERDDDVIVTSGGGVHSSFNRRQRALTPNTHLSAISFGSMSYGFPLALGAKLAAPDRQVVCVEGDGGFAMVMQDLETAVRYDIDVKTIIYNNFSHGTQKLRQGRLFDERYLGTDVDNPRFDRIAEEFGMTGLRVEDPQDLRGKVRDLFDTDGPALLDVIVDPWVWPGTEEIAQI